MKAWFTPHGIGIFQLLSGRSNVFLLRVNENFILVDTSYKYDWHRLDKKLKKLGVNKIDYLILTHSHFDHVDNACHIKEKYKARVVIHANESNNLISGNMEIPGGTNVFTRLLVDRIANHFKTLLKSRLCIPDIILDDENLNKEIVPDVRIIHTPGHSTGSLSIIVDNEIALVGDAMFGVFKNSVFPPFSKNVPEMIKSWKILLDTGCRIFIPSHGSAKMRDLLEIEYHKYFNRVNLY